MIIAMNELILSNNKLSNNFELNFSRYLQEIQKFPILEAEEEYNLALKVEQYDDREAAMKLIQSHLRLVAKIAFQFKKYGLAISDLVSEGNLGLVKALKKFKVKKGFRFSTYAMLWIKAYMQDYILKSWSLVKIGTTAAQKKLFFNLHKIKKALKIEADDSISNSHVKTISNSLNVSNREVKDMNIRMNNSDSSLNNIIGEDEEVGNFIECESPLQDEIVIYNQESEHKYDIIKKAMSDLNSREREILVSRNLLDKPMTLAKLSDKYNISRERVRQIEANAIKKIKKYIK